MKYRDHNSFLGKSAHSRFALARNGFRVIVYVPPAVVGAARGVLSRVLITSLFLCVLGTSASLCAQRYVHISANIETMNYGLDGTTNITSTFSVVCVVGTNTWRIDDNYSQNSERQWLFDGTNVYKSSRITKPPPRRIKEIVAKRFGAAIAPFEVAKTNITIYVATTPSGHPLGDVGVNIPWLAFCSGAYLRHEGRIIPLPDAVLRVAPDGFAYSDDSECFGDELGLPKRVELFTSKSLFQTSLQQAHFLGNHDVAAWKSVIANLQDGLLKFRYVVRESTNFLGWNLPTKFEYFKKEFGTNSDWVTRDVGFGSVTSIRVSDKPKYLFMTNMRHTVVDWRFIDATRGINALTYRLTNSIIPPTNDASLQRKFHARVKHSTVSPPVLRSRSRWAFVAFCSSTTLITLSVLVFAKHKPKNKRQ